MPDTEAPTGRVWAGVISCLVISPLTETSPFVATAKQVEDDDVEMICTKAVLKQIQVLTSALEEDGLLEEQQINLVQVSTHPDAGLHGHGLHHLQECFQSSLMSGTVQRACQSVILSP